MKKHPFSSHYLSISLLATWFGTGSILGTADEVSTKGFYSIIADPFAVILCLVVVAPLYVKWIRKSIKSSILEIFSQHYGSKTEKFAILITIPYYFGSTAAQWVGIKELFFWITGNITFAYFLLFTLFLWITYYTAKGELKAVILTDFWQCLMLAFGLLVTGSYLIYFAPISTEELMLKFSKETHAVFKINWGSLHDTLDYAGSWLMIAFSGVIGQEVVQRIIPAKSDSSSKKSLVFAGIGYLFLSIMVLTLGLLLAKNGKSLLQQLAVACPNWVFALFVLGLLGAAMSTADSYIYAGASLLKYHMKLPRFLQNQKSVDGYVVILSLLSMGCALWTDDIYFLIVHSGIFWFSSLHIPITLLIMGKVPQPWAMNSMLVVGTVAYLLMLFVGWSSFAACMVGWLSTIAIYGIDCLVIAMSKQASVRSSIATITNLATTNQDCSRSIDGH